MSSVPVQFLIYVMGNLSYREPPVFLPLTNYFEVQVGQMVNLSLFVMNYCNRTKSIVKDVINTASIVGMTISNVMFQIQLQTRHYHMLISDGHHRLIK
jgi:hypothetical protein